MHKAKFIAAFKEVLTENERKELDSLELTKDTVYYAADIIGRTSVDSAITNKDDEDGYYVI
jgi:hypothetical protein